jgi:hypothetical protein
MVALCSSMAGVRARVLRFEHIDFREQFDGIWACASLLHVPRSQMDDVFHRLCLSLKPGGVWFMSFKEGDGERIAGDGRVFSDYTWPALRALLHRLSGLQIVNLCRSIEHRAEGEVAWVNSLVRKVRYQHAE